MGLKEDQQEIENRIWAIDKALASKGRLSVGVTLYLGNENQGGDLSNWVAVELSKELVPVLKRIRRAQLGALLKIEQKAELELAAARGRRITMVESLGLEVGHG